MTAYAINMNHIINPVENRQLLWSLNEQVMELSR